MSYDLARRILAPVAFGAALTASCMARAEAPRWQMARSQTSAPQIDAASKAKFAEALRLYRAGNFAAALPLFTEIADTTRSPNARLYIGHCLTQLGKPADAHRAFSLTVKDIVEHPADKYEPTREAAQAQLAILNVRLAKLVIVVPDLPPGFALAVDDIAVEERDFGSSIVLEPGTHRITAGARGFEPIQREVTIEGGESKAIHLSLKKLDDSRQATVAPPSAPSRLPSSGTGSVARTAGYVAGSVGLVGLAAFTITGLAAKSTHDELQRECGESGCADQVHLDDIDRGKSLQTFANIGLVVGAVGVAVGGTLLLLSGRERQTAGPSISVYAGGGTISYRGQF